MSWTDERVTLLKKLWTDGLSASQIAKQLGGVTRNAVIGKVHRLGLSGRAAPSQPARPAFKAPRPARPAAQTMPSAPRRVVAPEQSAPAPMTASAVTNASPPSLPAYRDEQPGSATVLTLGAHMCKWPIGDPSVGRLHLLRPPQRRKAPIAANTPGWPTSRNNPRRRPARPNWPARCAATSSGSPAPIRTSLSCGPPRSSGRALCCRHDTATRTPDSHCPQHGLLGKLWSFLYRLGGPRGRSFGDLSFCD